jgi:hypothetical protein
MEDGGDPDQFIPVQPSLSGEWADSLTPKNLVDAILLPDEDGHRLSADDVEAICAAWEAGVDERFNGLVAAHCRNVLDVHEESH